MNWFRLRHSYVKRWVTVRYLSQPSNLNSYSQNQQKKILQVLNAASIELLQSYNVDRLCLPHLLEHRAHHGKFSSLNSLLEVNGLSEQTLQSLCQNILHASSQNEKIMKSLKVMVTPNFSSEHLQEINKILSLIVNGHFIAWACLDRNLVLHNWEVILFDEELKNNPIPCYTIARELFYRMPQADIFVMEEKTSLIRQSSRVEVTAYLKAFLTCFKNEASKPKASVVTVNERAVTRLFGLIVGGERVSGQNIVKSWLNGGATSVGHLKVDETLKQFYVESTSVNREYLSNVALLGVAFLKLVLLNNN